MTRSGADVDRLTRYLLGELSEEEQEAVERNCFRDPDAFQEILAVEEELFDAYAADELSGSQRTRFERRFLDSPQGHQRVEFARALKQWAATPRQEPRRPVASAPSLRERRVYRFAGAAAATALVAGVAWLFLQWAALRGDLARVRTEQAAAQARERVYQGQAADLRTRLEQLGEQLARERARPEAPERGPVLPPIVAFVLKPGLVRDVERSQAIVLPPGTDWAQVDLMLVRDDHPAYSVTLQTPEGSLLWSRGSLAPRSTSSGRAVRVSFQAGLLAQGHYVLSLRGVSPPGRSEIVEEYAFRVVKRR